MKQTRDNFGSKLGAILVAAGSAVGLGNIWRFPYVAGENGGGAFLLIYLVTVLLLGMPVMLGEFLIGRGSGRNAVGAYRSLKGHGWQTIGYNGVLAALLIFGFYAVVAGWTMEYVIRSATGALTALHEASEYEAFFAEFVASPWRPLLCTVGFVASPWRPLLCTVGFVALTHTIIALGVQKGIERSSKMLMPLLFVMLVVLCVRAVMMPGGVEGLKFLFRPDFSKVTSQTLLDAVGQAFFSMSVGMCCMITYASYFSRTTSLVRTALSVSLLDTLVAILAGIMIFPAVFSAGINPGQGASLAFITLPSILNSLAFSSVWSTLFFLLLMVAALTSTVSLHEVITAYLHEEWNLSRRTAACITSGAVMALGTLCALSFNLLADAKIFHRTFFDLFDFLTANIMMPVGGIFTCLFIGWALDRQLVVAQLSDNGRAARWIEVFIFIMRWLAPVLIAAVFFNNLGVLKL